MGYKQLLEVERGWRDMKQVLDLRPVYHRLEDRIRAHVLLCWLALLLIRVIETRATTCTDPAIEGPTIWPRAREVLQRLHVGLFTGPAGPSAKPPHPAPTSTACTPRSTYPCRRGSCTSTPNPPEPSDAMKERGLRSS